MVERIDGSPEIVLTDQERAFRWAHHGHVKRRADDSLKLKGGALRMHKSDAEGLSFWAERLVTEEESAQQAKNHPENFVGQYWLKAGEVRNYDLDFRQDRSEGEAHFELVGFEKFEEDHLVNITHALIQIASSRLRPLGDILGE